MRSGWWTLGVVIAAVGCSSEEATVTSSSAGGSTSGSTSSGTTSSSASTSQGTTVGSGTGGGPCVAPPAPTQPLAPAAGELFYAQLGLGGVSTGEAALVVGPDGTVVLIDVGNSSHDDDVADVLASLTGALHVDHIVVTHFHADHGDGLADLLGKVTLSGRLVHRGLTDLTPAANAGTIQSLCEELGAHPGAAAPLCAAATSAPCDPAAWTGTYPAVACAGLDSEDLALGAGAALDFIAANGSIAGDRYEALVGPILTQDSNGENARSVVGLLHHGAFRMLFAGDLTGGGSDTDDVESFYAARLSRVGVDASGVDVLHAGHHGRNTSSNATWVGALLPADGRSRNALTGISTAHLASPHAEVLANLLDGGRLSDGRFWTTTVATGGATAPGLESAQGGMVVLATLEGGAAYAIQSISKDGAVLQSRAFRSLAACR